MNKNCVRCGRSTPLEKFDRNSRTKDGRSSWCKPCLREYTTLKRQANALKIDALKAELGCVDCGERDPIVLDFDHVRGQKKYNLSGMRSRPYSWYTVEAELEKCVVRCANCHRRKTHERRITAA